jgi:hypothetical protein
MLGDRHRHVVLVEGLPGHEDVVHVALAEQGVGAAAVAAASKRLCFFSRK